MCHLFQLETLVDLNFLYVQFPIVNNLTCFEVAWCLYLHILQTVKLRVIQPTQPLSASR